MGRGWVGWEMVGPDFYWSVKLASDLKKEDDMTVFELAELYDEILLELSQMKLNTDEILQIYKTISSFEKSMVQPMMLNGLNQDVSKQANQLRQQIVQSLEGFAQRFDLLGSHARLIELRKTITEKDRSTKFSDFTEEMKKVFAFVDSHDTLTKTVYEYIKNRDINNLTKIFNSIEKVSARYAEIEGQRSFLSNLSKRLESTMVGEAGVGYKELLLYFYNEENNLSVFIEHHRSILAIYNEINALSNSSLGELRIGKIESGSFFEKLFGAEKIVDVISDLIRRVVDLVFKKYTFDGKMARKAEIVTFLNSELDLIQRCRELGIEVGQVPEEQIKKTIAVISSHVLRLASQSARVRVGDKEFSIEQESREKFLTETKRLLLDDENLTST